MEKSTQATRETIARQIQLNTRHPKLVGVDLTTLETLLFKRKHLRLTYLGYGALKQIVTCYEYTHDNSFKAKHTMALSNLKYPYYLSRKYFVLFSEEDSLMLSLYGDVNTFLEQSNLFR